MNISIDFPVGSSPTIDIAFPQQRKQFQSILSTLRGVVSQVQVRPSQIILIEPMYVDGIVITKEFPVVLSFQEEVFLATTSITDEYEVGDTESEAIRNFLASLANHFQWLTQEEAHLGIPLEAELRELRDYIHLV